MDPDSKIFIKHMLTYGLGGIMNGLSRLALIPIISVYLPPHVFGIYSLLLMVISFLFLLFDLGLSYALIKHYSEPGLSQSHAKAVGTSVTLISTGGGCLCVLALFLSPAFSRFLFQSVEYTPLFRLAVCVAFGGSVFQLLMSIFRASEKSQSFVYVTTLRGFSNIALTISLVILLSMGIEGFLWGSLLSFVLGMAAFFIIFKPPMIFSLDFARKLLRFGLPLMPSNLAIWLLTYADLYLLKRLAGLTAVGLYQFAQEMCVVISLLLISFERAWPQFVFSRYREVSAGNRFRHIFILFFTTLSFFGLAIALFRFELLSIVAADRYAESALVIPLLICSGILYGTYYVFGTGLLIQGKTFFFPPVTLSAAILNIVLNIVLIPTYGIIGAGLATVLTNLIMTLVILFLSNRYYPLSFDLGKVSLISGAGLIAYAGHHVFRGFLPNPVILNMLLLAGFSLFILKFVFLRSWDDTWEAGAATESIEEQ